MRALILGFFLVTLAACERLPDSTQGSCARSVEADVVFSNPEEPDRVTARAEGPSCAEAAVTLTIRDATGKLLWVFSAPYRNLSGGEGVADRFQPTPEEIDRFLASWADLTHQRSSALPVWPEGAAHLSGGDSGLSYDTDFGREAYEMLRARDLPEACFAIATEGSECIVMDPATSEAISIVRFGP
jgi:hypothetical protein